MQDCAPTAPQTFNALIRARWAAGYFLCVGLDPDLQHIIPTLGGARVRATPGQLVLSFNKAIIKATAEYAAAFKPNSAYYEWLGGEGFRVLKLTCDYIRKNYPHIPIILDAKRGDIADTNRGYVASFFDHYSAHAATLHPYLGRAALAPFLERTDKTFFILCRTSNAGGGEFQDLPVGEERLPLYLHVAKQVAREWNSAGNCGLVVGATYPAELRRVRDVAPDLTFLVPGVGAQGGTVADVMANGLDANGQGVIISASRSIIHASQGADFDEAAHAAAAKLHSEIVQHKETQRGDKRGDTEFWRPDGGRKGL